MRAREFTINVPINIKINGDGDPEIEVDGETPVDNEEDNPVFMSPQQQEIELAKAEQGKRSPELEQLVDPDHPDDENQETQEVGDPTRTERRIP